LISLYDGSILGSTLQCIRCHYGLVVYHLSFRNMLTVPVLCRSYRESYYPHRRRLAKLLFHSGMFTAIHPSRLTLIVLSLQVVKKQLIQPGLTKYTPLVTFNNYMIILSLAMDCLIIGMLSLKNPLIYIMVSGFS
jgi:hypothetical protein